MTPIRVRFRPALVLLSCAVLVLLFSAVRTRASAPTGRYAYPDPAGGTVLDTKTNLTWQQTPAPNNMTEPNGMTYCAGLTLAGLTWRLPTAKELLTLVDYSQAGGTVAMIDATAFPSTPATLFYSTTINGSNAIGVHFDTGTTDTSFPSQEAPFGIRCVH